MSSDSDKPGKAGSSNGSGPEPAAGGDEPKPGLEAAKRAPAAGAKGNGKARPSETDDKGAEAAPARVLTGSVSKKPGTAERRVLTASIEKGGGQSPKEPAAAKKPGAAVAAPKTPAGAKGGGASLQDSKAPARPGTQPEAGRPKAEYAGRTQERPAATSQAPAPKPAEAPAAEKEKGEASAAKDEARDPLAEKESPVVELRATPYPFDSESRRQRRVWPLLLFLLLVIAGGLGWLYWDLQGGSEGDAPAVAMTADDLRELEELLAKLEFAPGKVDGVVDEETRAALRLFQEFAGLPIDGEPSPALLEELREVVGMM